MKYIRTKDGRIVKLGEAADGGYAAGCVEIRNIAHSVETLAPFEISKEANTIEELCDEFVVKANGHNVVLHDLDSALRFTEDFYNHKLTKNYEIYGAIWTDKGLMYIAKMNEKGEMELL